MSIATANLSDDAYMRSPCIGCRSLCISVGKSITAFTSNIIPRPTIFGHGQIYMRTTPRLASITVRRAEATPPVHLQHDRLTLPRAF